MADTARTRRRRVSIVLLGPLLLAALAFAIGVNTAVPQLPLKPAAAIRAIACTPGRAASPAVANFWCRVCGMRMRTP